MKKRTRYLVLLFAFVVLVALMLAIPTTAMAKDGGNGNHMAIWYFHVDQDGNWILTGEDWGDTASLWASMTEHKGGVSEGVHDAKENGWNK